MYMKPFKKARYLACIFAIPKLTDIFILESADVEFASGYNLEQFLVII